jgi:hypothetical protein
MKKLFVLMVVVGAAGAAAVSLPDIRRYLEMRRM